MNILIVNDLFGREDYKGTYVFDTMGTTIPDKAVKELNEAFFKYATKFNYTQIEVDELKAIREKNPKDSEFLKRSGRGKVKLLEERLCTIELYPDVEPTFELLKANKYEITIFSKGALELVTAIYRQNGLLGIIGEENILSSTNFKVTDKTNPDCYLELRNKIEKRTGSITYHYVTDDADEANACETAQKLGGCVYYIDRGQKREKTLNEPTFEENTTLPKSWGVKEVDSLLNVIPLKTLKLHDD